MAKYITQSHIKKSPDPSHPKFDPDPDSTNLFVYGFPPTGGGEAAPIVKILAAHHIQTTTGLKIVNIREIHFIKGKVWDDKRCEFDTGKGVNIMVKGVLSQSHINKINKKKKTEDMYDLKYYLSDKKLNDHQKISMISSSYGKKLSETSNEKLNDKNASMESHKYIPLPLRSKKSANNELNNKIQENIKYNKNINDITPANTTILSTSKEIPNDLNDKIQENITYNKNLNDMTITNTSLAQIRTYRKINSSLKSNKNALKPSLKSQTQQTYPNDDEIYTESYKPNYRNHIPPSKRHTYTPTAHKSHLRKIKRNILNELNHKIQENIKYNKNINNIAPTNTTTDLPNGPNTDPNTAILSTSKAVPNDRNETAQVIIKHGTLSSSKEIPNDDNYIEDENKNNNIKYQEIEPPKTVLNDNNNIDNNGNGIIQTQTRYPPTNPHQDTYTIPPANPFTSENDKVYCNKNDEQYTIYRTYSGALRTNPPKDPSADPTTDPPTNPHKDRSKDPTIASPIPQIPDATLVHEKLNRKININENTSQKNEYAIMRALTHIYYLMCVMICLLGILLSTLSYRSNKISCNATRGELLSHQNGEKLSETSGETLKLTETFVTKHTNIYNKSIKPIKNQSLPIDKPTLTPNKYILNGKNENMLNGALILLIVCIILSIQYTNVIIFKKILSYQTLLQIFLLTFSLYFTLGRHIGNNIDIQKMQIRIGLNIIHNSVCHTFTAIQMNV